MGLLAFGIHGVSEVKTGREGRFGGGLLRGI